MEPQSPEIKYTTAIQFIKTAILQTQYQAVKLINREQLTLYFSIGKYISQNSRNRFWGTGAIAYISNRLQLELPGLRGFSERNLKNMRTFYEGWLMFEPILAVTTADVDDKEIRQLQLPNLITFPAEEFFSLSFTHHITILSLIKPLEERFFYIQLCSKEVLRVNTLKKLIKENVYKNQGSLPNNFIEKLPASEFARRAIMTFKDEYMLDFINVEELGARDLEEIDERIIENKIVQNIKNFLMTFGKDFTFVGNQYRIEAFGHTHIIDLLFFNRELTSLIAIELKTGSFKTAYLGQMNMYLRLLDDYVRKPHEGPSIGIILCKNADRKSVV